MVKGLAARCVRGLSGACAALALWHAPPASAAASDMPVHDEAHCARPALWVVGDADTTIFLFGTIHTHDGRAHWFDHAVRLAFERSDELVLETIVPTELPRVAVAPGSGLAVAHRTIDTARAAGLSVQLGADLVLARAADAAAKPVIGLESFDEQLRMYQALPGPTRPAIPAAAVSSPPAKDALAPFLRHMVESWNRGDAGPVETVVDTVKIQSPEAYRRLFSERNAAWARWIGRRLDRPGVVFVAVGTGHLVGPDSVQARLSQAGIHSARIN
ncbi:TraB/GumN family protein [Sphingomonas swuensis]|uniref:TraB/GumN family protein n=1 Tax=Sphingomonas swuensis TaxID=977800 RepID=A0ABP7T3B3_9SPHN